MKTCETNEKNTKLKDVDYFFMLENYNLTILEDTSRVYPESVIRLAEATKYKLNCMNLVLPEKKIAEIKERTRAYIKNCIPDESNTFALLLATLEHLMNVGTHPKISYIKSMRVMVTNMITALETNESTAGTFSKYRDHVTKPLSVTENAKRRFIKTEAIAARHLNEKIIVCALWSMKDTILANNKDKPILTKVFKIMYKFLDKDSKLIHEYENSPGVRDGVVKIHKNMEKADNLEELAPEVTELVKGLAILDMFKDGLNTSISLVKKYKEPVKNMDIRLTEDMDIMKRQMIYYSKYEDEEVKEDTKSNDLVSAINTHVQEKYIENIKKTS